jgi:glycerophosphoryl diester phosphodiesterase
MAANMAAPPLLIGHRGARGIRSITENTFRSFDSALQSGCDGFEFDVRLSGDKRAVVLHDSRHRSLTVASSTFAQLQRGAKPRSSPKKNTSKQESELVCAEQVIARYRNRAFLDIELKVAGLETMVLDSLRQAPARDYVVSSFLPDVLWEMKARSAATTGMICDRKTQLSRWPKMPTEYVIVEQKLLSHQLIEELHAARRRVFVWTVNTPARMRRFADWGVDGVISDHPGLLVETMREWKHLKGDG